jgi:hypothetical protein
VGHYFIKRVRGCLFYFCEIIFISMINMSIVLIRVELLKKGFKSSKINYESTSGLLKITVDNKSLVEKDGEWFLKCSDEPSEDMKRIDVPERNVL